MLVFRNSSAAPGKTRKNKGFSSIVKSQAKAAEQAEAEAMAQAQAQLDSRPKRRGRPSKAQREADEAQVRQAAATARSSSVLAPLTKPSLPRAQKSPDIAASVRRKAKQDIQATYADAPLSVLRAAAKELGLKGFSQKTKAELLAAVVRAEVQAEVPKMKSAPKARKSRKGIAPSAEARKKISATHKARSGRRAGVGIYRVAVLVNGQFDANRGADLGPYATARAAAIDAKTLLRTAARVEDHRISQTQALAMIEAGDPALDEFATHLGPVVDGFIVDGMVNGRAWEAWVYRVSKRTPATSRALLDNVLPTGDVVESMALRANSRRNSNVSFRTRDGRKISFRARK